MPYFSATGETPSETPFTQKSELDSSSAPFFSSNPPPAEPEYTTTEVPDIDPASGAAIGSTTTVKTPVPKKYEDYPTIAEMPLKASSPVGTLKMMAGLPFAE